MRFVQQQPSSKAPSDWFTGDVWWDVIHADQEPSRMRVDMVRFSPGSRTNWHSHVLGQALHVVFGVALIGNRDGTIAEARPGETITCLPGEEHWHGAVSDRFMEHLALWESKDDGCTETTWAGPFTDEQYHGPQTRELPRATS
ncbi:(R)-mandelonitrile lyase [Streptomyces massasporeus]|uniref:(R)-mandelonitrile lyase n=1 Tax=Streptomyces massasporeus TaxID=67324 RepID=UPI001676BE00|nr:cupin domain-containing protein [Streptomyces massasporeus]GGV61264.1 cupin [Streptomyces massasporeus]